MVKKYEYLVNYRVKTAYRGFCQHVYIIWQGQNINLSNPLDSKVPKSQIKFK